MHDIVRLFNEELVPVREIAKIHNISRQQIYNILKFYGADTSKTVRVSRECPVCDKGMLIHKSTARRTKHTFCCKQCYDIFCEVSLERYSEKNVWKRLALNEIKIHFSIKDDNSIHFKDSDRTHFNANNLIVFENEKEHLRFHKGYKVTPLWGK